MSKSSLGEFEKLVMLAVPHLGPEAHGATIIEVLAERTGRTSSPGAVYVALGRLEKKGLVASRLGDPSPRPGGRPKRCYSVEKEGVESLLQAREEWSAMMRGFEGMLERAP